MIPAILFALILIFEVVTVSWYPSSPKPVIGLISNSIVFPEVVMGFKLYPLIFFIYVVKKSAADLNSLLVILYLIRVFPSIRKLPPVVLRFTGLGITLTCCAKIKSGHKNTRNRRCFFIF